MEDAKLFRLPVVVEPGAGPFEKGLEFELKAGVNLLRWSNGAGKALRNGTPVLTPGGWLPIEELKVGDTVFDRSGEATEVAGVYPQGERDLYRVQFTDDAIIDADADHLWPTWRCGGSERLMTTRQLAEWYEKARGRSRNAQTSSRFRTPPPPLVRLPKLELPIDPYTLGVILGDSGMSGSTPSLTKVEDLDILDRLQCEVRPRRTPHTYGLAGLYEPLGAMGLSGLKTHEKFVPGAYLFSSLEDRRELLAGLLDTDGYTDRHNIEFSSASPALADAVEWLVRSLGGHCRRGAPSVGGYKAKGGERVDCRDRHRLGIRMPTNPFFCERKSSLWSRSRNGFDRIIESVTAVEPDEATCIAVTSSTRCYIAAGNVVTHNTYLMRVLAKLNQEKFQVGDLTVNDRMTGAVARVRVGTAVMSVRQGHKPVVTGQESLPPIEGLPDPIGILITGDHRKGEVPAFKARLKALLVWTGIEADEATVERLLGPNKQVQEIATLVRSEGDAIELAESIRNEMHRRRREAEKYLEARTASLGQLEGRKVEVLGEHAESVVQEVEPNVFSMRREAEAARDALSELRTRRKTLLEEQERREAAGTSLGPQPDLAPLHEALEKRQEASRAAVAEHHSQQELLSRLRADFETAERGRNLGASKLTAEWEELKAWLGDLQAQVFDAEGLPRWGNTITVEPGRVDKMVADVAAALAQDPAAAYETLKAEVEAASNKLAALHRAKGDAGDEVIAAESRLAEGQRSLERWEETKRRLESPVEIPSEEAVAEKETALAEAESRLELHEVAVRYQELGARIEGVRTEAESFQADVSFWSDEAQAVWTRLAAVVNERLESDVVRVEEEEVQIQVDGTWYDIADDERVSEGRRHAACYGLLLQHRSGQRVVLIEDSTAVDPERLEALGREARWKNVALVLETPIDSQPGVYAVEYWPRSEGSDEERRKRFEAHIGEVNVPIGEEA